MIEANARAVSVEAGLAILQALKEGGWKCSPYRPVPRIVKETLLELRSRGVKGVDLAKLAGISAGTIAQWRHTPRLPVGRYAAAASLAVA